MRRGTSHTPEAREKIRLASRQRWQDPEYRARMLTHVLGMAPLRGGRKKGTRQSPEAREKIRATMIKRWQDPEFRARHLPQLLSVQSKGHAALAKKRIRPPAGTPEYRQYEKIRIILGPEAARSIQW